MLDLGVLHTGTAAHKSKPGLGCGMTQSPLDCRQNVTFHLDEGGFFVGLATDLSEILNGWYTLLGVLELGSNPQCSTTDELIVFDVDYTARDIAIYNVECEVKRLRTQAESEMDFHEKVNKAWAHMPPNLRLLIHRLSRGHGKTLKSINLRIRN